MRVGGELDQSTAHPSSSYPQPRFPLLPVLTWDTFTGQRAAVPIPSVTDAGTGIAVSSGTAAIALALKQAGIGASDRVLVPAFHCGSMIEPVLAQAAIPVYYRIHGDTSIDLADIHSKMDGATRALLVTHYFGFPQDMPTLRAFCDHRGLLLIEDCAHAFFGACGDRPIGWYGDYAVASVRKFFPTCDGGYLTSSRHSVKDIPLKVGGLVFNTKAALDIVEEAVSFGRLRPLNYVLALPFYLKKRIRSWIKSVFRGNVPGSATADAPQAYRYLDIGQVNRRMSFPSGLILRITARSRIVRLRRANYLRLVQGLSGLARGRPLRPELPDGVVPYMFPFLVDDPDTDFPRLKNMGIPIFRWEDMHTADCPISASYASCLLQLPCHQDVRVAELDWMIQCIAGILGRK